MSDAVLLPYFPLQDSSESWWLGNKAHASQCLGSEKACTLTILILTIHDLGPTNRDSLQNWPHLGTALGMFMAGINNHQLLWRRMAASLVTRR